jgi:hypothetical protein
MHEIFRRVLLWVGFGRLHRRTLPYLVRSDTYLVRASIDFRSPGVVSGLNTSKDKATPMEFEAIKSRSVVDSE